MNELKKERIEEFKRIWEEEYGIKLTDAEAKEYSNNLLQFAEIMYKCAESEFLKKQKLKKSPKGFHLEDGIYNCLICYKQITGEESWYNELGPKCMTCQKAIDNKTIPKSICKNRDSWFAMWELKSKFGIHPQTTRKLMRNDELKARIIKDSDGKDYFYVFLIKENEEFFKNRLNNK